VLAGQPQERAANQVGGDRDRLEMVAPGRERLRRARRSRRLVRRDQAVDGGRKRRAGTGAHVREDSQRVRYLVPPPAALLDGDTSEPVRWILFPRYDPTAATRLQPLDRSVGLQKLLDESLVDVERRDRRTVESLTAACRDASSH
jgi:hypothetical protein